MICPECNGAGVLIYDVITGGPGDWHGAYISEREEDCDHCGGSGEIDDEEPDE